MIHLLVLALRMYNIYIYHFMSFYKQIFPCLLPPSRYWFETEKHYLFLLFFFSKVFLVHLFECQLIYPSHQRPYWPLLTQLLFQSHCDYHRSFFTIILFFWFLPRQSFSPVLHFLDFFSKLGAHIFFSLRKSWVSDPFFGLFLVISEVGSQIYIANLAIFKIWVFSATFWHEITLYAIDIDKKRFRTPFLTL